MKTLIQYVNRLRATRIRRNLQNLGVNLTDVTCSHRLLVKADQGPLRSEQFCVGVATHLQGRFVVGIEGRINIGKHCSFRGNTHISAKTKVTIGDHVFGAEDIFVSDNDNHPTSPAARREMTMSPPGSQAWKMTEKVVSRPIEIQEGVWIGKAAIILKGVTIGRWSVVAAGAVVTKDVPPFSIVAGNPARVVKSIENDLNPDMHRQ